MRNLPGRIRLNNLLAFIMIVNDLVDTRIERVQKRYTNQYTDFAQTFEFLRVMKLVSYKDDNSLVYSPKITEQGQVSLSRLKTLLLNKLLSSRGPYKEIVRQFFLEFSWKQSHFSIAISQLNLSKYSHVRDLFIEVDAIQRKSRAFILRDFLEYQLTEFLVETAPGKRLKESLDAQGKIGIKAEEIITEYEKQRLSSFKNLSSKVKCIADSSPGAGFDIISYELPTLNEHLIVRHIEVKAVRKHDKRFFWTRNEIDTAMRLRQRYSLYLLPFTENETALIDDLLIISDPIFAVLENRMNWDIQPEVFTCKLIH